MGIMKISLSRCAASLGVVIGLSGLASAADPATQSNPIPPRFSAGSGQTAPPPAAPPPASSPNVNPATLPNPADASGFVYNRQRIKRTVPMDLTASLEARWDRLYTIGYGETRRTVYLDWDDNYLYIAAESAAPETVRVDLDARGDSWFRGADNIAIIVAPPVREGDVPLVTAQRWDTLQNKQRPVWAESPIPVGAIRVVQGRTAAGTYATLLAIGGTEAAGLKLRPGADFGIRVEGGASSELPGDTAALPTRAMLPAVLTTSQSVREGGVSVRVGVSPGQIVTGEGVRTSLEIKNEGGSPVRIARLFLRGSQGTQAHMDAATYTGMTLKPGETVKREFPSTVAGGAGYGTMVVAGGAELENGGSSVAALASFDRVEPYSVSLSVDGKAVASGAGGKRTVLVTLSSLSKQRAEGTVTLHLPAAWKLENAERRRRVGMPRAGLTEGIYYRLLIPATAAPGEYPLRADLQAGGRTYTASASVIVTRAVAAP